MTWILLSLAILCFLLGYIEPRPMISLRWAAASFAWVIIAAIDTALRH
jgi:hypothetical protein